jgi:hypothetical protein
LKLHDCFAQIELAYLRISQARYLVNSNFLVDNEFEIRFFGFVVLTDIQRTRLLLIYSTKEDCRHRSLESGNHSQVRSHRFFSSRCQQTHESREVR